MQYSRAVHDRRFCARIASPSFTRKHMLDSSDTPGRSARRALVVWRDPRRIALGLAAGAVVGLIELGVLISLAALIFSGPLAGMVASGIGLTLVGACVINIV